MRSRGPRSFWRFAALAAAVSGLAWLAAPTGDRDPALAAGEPHPQAKLVSRSPRLLLDHVEHAAFGAEGTARVRIDRLEARQRKIGVFTLSSFTELEIDGLRLDLGPCEASACATESQQEREADASVIREVLEESIRSLPVGIVTRIRVDGFQVSWSRDERRLHLAAGHAALGTADRAVALRAVVVEAHDGERLVARRARWRPDTRELVVERGYEWHRREGRSEVGEQAVFRLDPRGGGSLAVLDSGSG